jgi:regulatory protein
VRKQPDLRSRALSYLSRREYSRAELAAKLRPYAVDESGQRQDIDALLTDLAESGYLSDERAVVQILHARRPRFGSQRILHELHQKGISSEVIEQVAPTLHDTELETARSVWQKKYGELPRDAKEKARQMRFLHSRGFSMDVIFKLLRHEDPE